MSRELEFFREVMRELTSSTDLSAAIEHTFHFLKKYFPLSALSLHQYSPGHSGLKLLFLITDNGFYHVEKLVPIETRAGKALLERFEVPRNTLIEPVNKESPVGVFHSRGIEEFLAMQPRAYLVGSLGLGPEVVGHLVLLGNQPQCFTEEHHRLLQLLMPPFSMAMANMLQIQRVVDFQNRLSHGLTRQEETNDRIAAEHHLIGLNSGLEKVFTAIRQLEGRDLPVLITGETGTGKELVADAVQRLSRRRDKPFIKVNCGAMPESLIDSELFGYERGAFTGAQTLRAGLFEQADGGTLFLDEVGELTPSAQVRLLRILQDGVLQRLGGRTSILVDVRIIAATNRNLDHLLQSGAFREDLYYRLNVFPLHIPPLRERAQDIPLLLQHSLSRGAARLGLPVPRPDPASLERLMAYSWPGNVREMENLVERALTLEKGRNVNIAKYLPHDPTWYLSTEKSEDYLQKLIDERLNAALSDVRSGTFVPKAAGRQPDTMPEERSGAEPLRSLDQAMAAHIQKALAASNGKINGPGGAAELLGLHPNTLRKRMQKLGIAGRTRENSPLA